MNTLVEVKFLPNTNKMTPPPPISRVRVGCACRRGQEEAEGGALLLAAGPAAALQSRLREACHGPAVRGWGGRDPHTTLPTLTYMKQRLLHF